MRITLDHRRFFRGHLLCILVLVCIYAVVKGVALASGHPHMLGLVPLFDMDGEDNVPALFSTDALLAGGVLAWMTGTLARARRMPLWRHWRLLGLLFGYLAADESFEFHENLGVLLRAHFTLFAAWQHSWVFAYAIVMAAVGPVFIDFLRRLPRNTRNELIVAGCIFVMGAMVIEFAWGVMQDRLDIGSPVEDMIEVAIEESTEMLGVALFIRAVLKYATDIQSEAA